MIPRLAIAWLALQTLKYLLYLLIKHHGTQMGRHFLLI